MNLSPDEARSLAQTLSAERSKGADARALRELISNRLRIRKRVAEDLYQRFDRAWHRGVQAKLGAASDPPPLEADALAHFAFEEGCGRTARLIEERAPKPDAARTITVDDTGSETSERAAGAPVGGPEASAAFVSTIVAALVWWLSDAEGWRLAAAVAVAFVVCFTLYIQEATVIEYGIMSAPILAAAGLAAFAGAAEFFWPVLSATLVGALMGTGSREARRRPRNDSPR